MYSYLRKTIFILSVSVIPLISSAQNYSGDTWAQVKADGKGNVSFAYVETPGFVYKDKTGKLTGICVDIMDEFVKYINQTKNVKLGSKFVGDGSNFKGMYDKVTTSSGGVFGLGNITITEERRKDIKFSPPFITNFAILITHNEVPTLAKLEDLPITFAKLTAYTAKGTLNESRIKELKQKYFTEMKINITSTSQETLSKMVDDPNGFAYQDLAFYLDAIQKHKSIKRHPVGDKGAEQFGFAMPKNSDWYPLLDEFFRSNGGFTNSAVYKNILTKHLGETGVKLLQSATK